MPTREHVKKALAKMTRRADYEYFFDKIDSEKWLEPLFEEGVFNKPEEPIQDGDTIRFPIWPPAKYLKKVASKAPDTVIKIIKSTPSTSNPRVHEDFLEALKQVHPEKAVKLKSQVLEWINNNYLLLLPDSVREFCNILENNGFPEDAMEIMSSLLDVEPTKSKSDKSGLFIKPYIKVRDDWTYNKLISEYVPGLSLDSKMGLFWILCEKLKKTIEIEERDGLGVFVDNSCIWRGTIEPSSQTNDFSIKDKQIEWVRKIGEQIFNEKPELLIDFCNRLIKYPYPIFSRFALYFCRELPADRELKFSLLSNERLFSSNDVWHEYAELLSKAYPELTNEEKDEILKMISSIKDSESAQEKGWDGLSKYYYYYMIRDHLVGDAKNYFGELYKKYGEQEHPSFHYYSGGVWHGPQSPKSEQELKEMSADEIVDLLKNWKPDGDPPFRESIEGLAGTLERAVTAEPQKFISDLQKFRFEEKTYVRSVIQGLGTGLNSLESIDWKEILEYVNWASSRTGDLSTNSSTDEDDRDPSWSWTRQAACRFLDKAFSLDKNEPPLEVEALLWSVLAFGLGDPDPFVETEDKYTSSGNYYQTAINSTRGEALEAAVRFGLWQQRSKKIDKSKSDRTMYGPLFEAFDYHLNINNDPSKAVRAIYGRWLPFIALLDRKWVAENLELIFPPNPDLAVYRSAAWNAYILFCSPYTNFYPLVANYYYDEVKNISGDDSVEWDKPSSRLIEHLTCFYLNETIQLDDHSMVALLNSGNINVRKNLINFVGRVLMRKGEKLPAIFSQRAVKLWNQSLNIAKASDNPLGRVELSEFGWWISSKYLDPKWALNQSIEVIEITHHISPDHMVMDALLAQVDSFPEEVIRVLSLMVDYRVSDYGFYGWIKESEILLRKLMKTKHRKEAENIIHKLGAFGFNQFRELLT